MKATKRLLIVPCLLLCSWVTHAGEVPGSYTKYAWNASVTSLSSVDYQILVSYPPGDRANIRWSNQFQLAGTTSHGYAGMENTAKGGTSFVFSVSGATQFQPGSPGSACTVGNSTEPRVTCRLPYAWTIQSSYQFHLAYVGGQWLSVTVTDPTNNQTVTLGSILTDATSLSPHGIVSRTRYLEGNSPAANCYDQPSTDAVFYVPSGDGGQYTATVSKGGVDANCSAWGFVESNSVYSEQTNLFDNSPRGTVQNESVATEICMAAGDGRTNGATVNTKDCNSHAEGQAWVLASDYTIRLQSNLCVDVADPTATSPQVVVDTCNNSATQQWLPGEGYTLQNAQNGLCLTMSQPKAPLTLQTCSGDPDQSWAIPSRGLD